MFKRYKYFPGLPFNKAFDAMMDIVTYYNLRKTAPLLYQRKILRVEMIKSEDRYILEICKWVEFSDNATNKIIRELTIRKLVKEMFNLEMNKITI